MFREVFLSFFSLQSKQFTERKKKERNVKVTSVEKVNSFGFKLHKTGIHLHCGPFVISKGFNSKILKWFFSLEE